MKKIDVDGQVDESLTLPELCRFCDADDAWVIEMVEHGALEANGGRVSDWTFGVLSIARARKARRLQQDMELSPAGLALILDLIEERDMLRRRLVGLDAI